MSVSATVNSPGLPEPSIPTGVARLQLIALIEADISYGVTVSRACERHGVPRSTYYVWKQEQKENDPGAETTEAAIDAPEETPINQVDSDIFPRPTTEETVND